MLLSDRGEQEQAGGPGQYPETADIDTASDDYASRFAGETGRYFLDVQTGIILDLLRDFAGCSVLDVGGGHAQSAVPLVRHGYRLTVTGSDDVCRQRLDRFLAPGSFQYRTCDSLHLPFADNAFDFVLAVRLLPHVERWPELLAEMCRVARRGVILDYPDQRSFNVLYRLLFQAKKALEGNTRTFTLFSRGQLRRELEKNGFSAPDYRPEFFFPMVLHRKLGRPFLSRTLEAGARLLGLRRLFGSPIILRSRKRQEGSRQKPAAGGVD